MVWGTFGVEFLSIGKRGMAMKRTVVELRLIGREWEIFTTFNKGERTEIVKTFEGDVKELVIATMLTGCTLFGGAGWRAACQGALIVSSRAWDEKKLPNKRCIKRFALNKSWEKNVVVDPALLERIKEKLKTLDANKATKRQLIEERDFCCKEAAKWIACLESIALKTDDDEMLKYIEQSIQDAKEKMAKLVGQFNEELQESIDAGGKFEALYRKQRSLFETASGNAAGFKFPTENIEQIFDELFAKELTGKDMKTSYEVVKKAKRAHQMQFTAEEERRAAKQNLVKAKPTKCQIAEFGASSSAADV
ncbi:hypothetical protein niasHT_017377 [Heterodera trifolii]|uniref:Uncharacterized protein n=1 Tax=Heterodera trifolii TaxID=157864 RepID=A0ABD2L7Q5_9BILA